MRYYLPRFSIASMQGEQTFLRSKIGGVPWGFPADRWPICCDQPQKLLAQLCHAPPFLDLGASDAVLHLFQCLECGGVDCAADLARDSLNLPCAAIILHRSELDEGLSRIDGYDAQPEFGEKLIGELWIEGWDESDDGIPDSRLADCFKEHRVWKLQDDYPEIEWFETRERTRFGGIPRWTGNGPTAPDPPFEFLFQLDTAIYLPGPPPPVPIVGCNLLKPHLSDDGLRVVSTEVTRCDARKLNAPWAIEYQDEEHHLAEYTNFASDGTAFVFINRTKTPHEVKWFYSR